MIQNHRKIIVGLSEDVRVIIIKLADRLHNMRTFDAISTERQKKVANETLSVLVPIAHRLGINSIKSELENLCLYYLKPDVYNDILEKLNATVDSLNNYLIEKEYIYNYTNKKMYLLKDYYSYYYGSLYNPKRDLVLKYYDLNGKQRTNDYEFTIRTVKGTNRYGDEIIEDNYYDYTGKYINNDYLKIFSSWSIQSYENSLKLPNVINPKNIGLYDIWGGLLALGSEYQIYDDDSREYNGYDYSGKDYIFGINIYNDSIYTNYYIIDLETKSKINYKNVINKEEYEKRLKEYENKLKERGK